MSAPNATQLAAKLRSALTSNLAGLNASIAYGTIAAVPPTSNANTVNVYLNNNAAGAQPSTADNVPYLSDYSPAVGDAVILLAGQAASKTSYVVLGTLSGATGGGSSGVPVGFIGMFTTAITYPNWLLCNGGTFSAVTYPALSALLGGTTLPNLANLLPMGAGSIVSLGNTAGAATSTGLLAHVHGSGGPHSHTSAAHVHGSGGPHSHSHNHGPSAGTAFVVETGGGGSIPAGGAYNVASNTDTDATATDPGNTASTTPGASGSTDPGNTASAGSGSSFSILNPVLGVAYYIKAA